jgi:hypothetical protein
MSAKYFKELFNIGKKAYNLILGFLVVCHKDFNEPWVRAYHVSSDHFAIYHKLKGFLNQMTKAKDYTLATVPTIIMGVNKIIVDTSLNVSTHDGKNIGKVSSKDFKLFAQSLKSLTDIIKSDKRLVSYMDKIQEIAEESTKLSEDFYDKRSKLLKVSDIVNPEGIIIDKEYDLWKTFKFFYKSVTDEDFLKNKEIKFIWIKMVQNRAKAFMLQSGNQDLKALHEKVSNLKKDFDKIENSPVDFFERVLSHIDDLVLIKVHTEVERYSLRWDQCSFKDVNYSYGDVPTTHKINNLRNIYSWIDSCYSSFYKDLRFNDYVEIMWNNHVFKVNNVQMAFNALTHYQDLLAFHLIRSDITLESFNVFLKRQKLPLEYIRIRKAANYFYNSFRFSGQLKYYNLSKKYLEESLLVKAGNDVQHLMSKAETINARKNASRIRKSKLKTGRAMIIYSMESKIKKFQGPIKYKDIPAVRQGSLAMSTMAEEPSLERLDRILFNFENKSDLTKYFEKDKLINNLKPARTFNLHFISCKRGEELITMTLSESIYEETGIRVSHNCFLNPRGKNEMIFCFLLYYYELLIYKSMNVMFSNKSVMSTKQLDIIVYNYWFKKTGIAEYLVNMLKPEFLVAPKYYHLSAIKEKIMRPKGNVYSFKTPFFRETSAIKVLRYSDSDSFKMLDDTNTCLSFIWNKQEDDNIKEPKGPKIILDDKTVAKKLKVKMNQAEGHQNVESEIETIYSDKFEFLYMVDEEEAKCCLVDLLASENDAKDEEIIGCLGGFDNDGLNSMPLFQKRPQKWSFHKGKRPLREIGCKKIMINEQKERKVRQVCNCIERKPNLGKKAILKYVPLKKMSHSKKVVKKPTIEKPKEKKNIEVLSKSVRRITESEIARLPTVSKGPAVSVADQQKGYKAVEKKPPPPMTGGQGQRGPQPNVTSLVKREIDASAKRQGIKPPIPNVPQVEVNAWASKPNIREEKPAPESKISEKSSKNDSKDKAGAGSQRESAKIDDLSRRISEINKRLSDIETLLKAVNPEIGQIYKQMSENQKNKALLNELDVKIKKLKADKSRVDIPLKVEASKLQIEKADLERQRKGRKEGKGEQKKNIGS